MPQVKTYLAGKTKYVRKGKPGDGRAEYKAWQAEQKAIAENLRSVRNQALRATVASVAAEKDPMFCLKAKGLVKSLKEPTKAIGESADGPVMTASGVMLTGTKGLDAVDKKELLKRANWILKNS